MVNIQFDLKLKKLLIKVGFYLYKFSFFLSNAISDKFLRKALQQAQWDFILT